MPPKKSSSSSAAKASAHSDPMDLSKPIAYTDAELNPTSKSMYGDSKARVSSNVYAIHDKVRNSAYMNAIQNGFKGKRVLHLGCGMGLLSMIAARAQASFVLGVDSSVIVDAATKVAADNKLDNVSFFRGTVSDLIKNKEINTSKACDKFDVLMCEWMGPFLSNDANLRDVLQLKKVLLADDGIICPNRSSLHVVGITDYPYYSSCVDYWDSVYGFDMKAMKPLVFDEASQCGIPKSCIVTNSCKVHTVLADELPALPSCEDDDGGVEKSKLYLEEVFAWSDKPFSLVCNKKATVHFLSFYIDCTFTHKTVPGANFVLGFTPGGNTNCWTEVSVTLPEALPVFPTDVISGAVSIRPGKLRKTTEVVVSYALKNTLVDVKKSHVYTYAC